LNLNNNPNKNKRMLIWCHAWRWAEE